MCAFMPDFLFVTCQVGAEPAVKNELARRWPAFRPAFSRRGFLTFKLPAGHGLAEDFDLDSVFARAYGFCLGKIGGLSAIDRAQAVWKTAAGQAFQRIHVWERDARGPGERDFEPAITPAAVAAHRLIHEHCPCPATLAGTASDARHPARSGERVLDCVMVGPDEWWVGYHRAKSSPSRHPGGLLSLELPASAVSRAWLKMEEGLRWSELPIPRGARVAEIGSAPGGASQALLARGFWVTGIDPAEMAEVVLAHPHFVQIRRRSTQVRRRDLRKIRWLTADMNVAPQYTLDAVEGMVTHPQINIRGMLLTLKLPEWELASHVPDFLERIRCWGYNLVRARQLQYDRREICVAALQKPFRRKSPIRKTR